MKRDGRTAPRLDTTAARMFVAIIEEGSIARAAARENIVASAVSKRLSDLEGQLQVALVRRGRRGIEPTPAGEAFAHHARMVLQALDRMQGEMAEYIEGVRGHVRVRASPSALSSGLPADIQAFTRVNRHVRLELEGCDTPMIVQHVVDGRADVGIGPNIFRHDALQLFPYRRYDLAVAVPPRHPLARRKHITYAETLGYDQVELTTTSALAQLLDYAAKQSSHIKRTRIRVQGFDAVCMMIACGMGIGVVPSFLKMSCPADRQLAFVPLSDDWAHPLICIMVRDFTSLPSAAQAFVTHLRKASPEPV